MDLSGVDTELPTLLSFTAAGETIKTLKGANLSPPQLGQTVRFADLDLSNVDMPEVEEEGYSMPLDGKYKVEDIIYDYISVYESENDMDQENAVTVQFVRVILTKIENE